MESRPHRAAWPARREGGVHRTLTVAAHFRLNWKTVAAVVEGAVLWGLDHRRWHPLHLLGIDEVSRRKGQQYLTIVYDLARGRVVWVGRDRTTATMERFFAWLGPRRARSIRTVCCDMWAVYIDAVRTHLAKVIGHRAFGSRTSWTYIANIHHCCAGLPLP